MLCHVISNGKGFHFEWDVFSSVTSVSSKENKPSWFHSQVMVIESRISAVNIVRIHRGRRPFFPTECQPFLSCYLSGSERQRCLKSHLGHNWIRTEPVKPRQCLEAELCFAITLTDSWAKEQKGRPSKLLWVNGEPLWTWTEISAKSICWLADWKQTSSKAVGLIQGLNVEIHLYTFCFVCFVCVSLCSRMDVRKWDFWFLWSATVSVEMPPYIMVLKWPNRTGSNCNRESPVSVSHLERESSWNCGMRRKSVWKCNIVVFVFFVFFKKIFQVHFNLFCHVQILILYFSKVLRNKDYLKTTPSSRVEISPDV